MEIDDAKKELLSFHNNLLYVKLLKSNVQKDKDKAEKITSILSDMPMNRDNSVTDKKAEYIADMADADKEIAKIIDLNIAFLRHIIAKIDNLPQPYKNILYMKYISVIKKGYESKTIYMSLDEIYHALGNDDIRFLSLKQIGNRIGYDKDYVSILHGKAIELYSKQ